MEQSPSNSSADQAVRPIVSVVVPTHDYARYLPEAIESVRAQTFVDWECIVVDDGSTDGTPKLLERFVAMDPRIRPLRQAQRGVSAARNRGLELGLGRYIQFLDADDLLRPQTLERHVQTLERRQEIDIVYGPTRYFDDDDPNRLLRPELAGPSESPGPPARPDEDADELERLIDANIMTVAAPLVRRSVFESVGRFDERMERLEDWDLWLRCAAAGKRFLYVPSDDPVALIRVHAGSLSEVPPRIMFPSVARMRERLSQNLTPTLRAKNRRLLAEARSGAGIEFGLAGHPGHGLRLLFSSIVAEPRRRWLLWAVALLAMQLPGGNRLVRRIRSRWRSRAT